MIIKAKYTEDEVRAVIALFNGVANDVQQKIALDWIMKEAARVPDLAFHSGVDGRRDTDFALGRQYVGHLIREMLIPQTLIIAQQRKGE